MDMTTKTSLSAGLVVYRLLTSDEAVMNSVTKIFPVVTDEAILPYVAYRRSGWSGDLTKGDAAGTATVEVRCYAKSYAESVDLAEKVRAALDYRSTDGSQDDGLRLRACFLTNAEEFAEGDAYVQHLVFTLRI